MEFIKAHANGNDFIIVRKGDWDSDPGAICDRHYGVGADGVLIWEKKNSCWFMEIINADGSESPICVNGLRALGLYLMEENNMHSIEIHTRSGINLVEKEGEQVSAVVGLGDVKDSFYRLEIEGRVFDIHYFYINNPHALFFGEWEERDFFRYAPGIQEKLGANVSFVRKMPEGDGYYAMVWERGAGYTLSCGSAAICIFYYLETKYKGHKYNIVMAGGPAMVSREKGSFRLTGKAEIVFTGRMNSLKEGDCNG